MSFLLVVAAQFPQESQDFRPAVLMEMVPQVPAILPPAGSLDWGSQVYPGYLELVAPEESWGQDRGQDRDQGS